jgi:ribosome-binding factor A
MSKLSSSAGQRQLRVGEQIRHSLAWILERGEVRDPALAAISVTVTEVRIGPDLRNATVFVMPLGGGQTDAALAALKRAKGFLRRRIAENVRLKFVPDLVFCLDRSFEQADQIERALREPKVARDLDDDRKNDASR